MSKSSEAANAVMNAVEQVLNLYGVRSTREQSRTIMVEGVAGRWRPMSFGKWIDDNGETHTKGRADILARPRIAHLFDIHPLDTKIFGTAIAKVSVPLWIECKSGKGTMSHDQRAFQKWVTDNGDYFLTIHDDVRPLIEWLEEHGVKKEPKTVIHAQPMNAMQVEELPCRHCRKPKAEHKGTIFACISSLKVAIGKVYSPDLKVTK